MYRHRIAALILAGALTLFPVLAARAQDATPQADQNAPLGERTLPSETRVDLAAIALDDADAGTDYTLSFETYISAAQIPTLLFGGAISESVVEATGIRWFYESQYQSTDGDTTIRAYAEEYKNVASVQKGFDLFESERSDIASGVTSKDSKGLAIGDSPSEVTTTTVKASGSTPASNSLDATFRVDRLLVGVAIDSTANTAPTEDELTPLAKRMAERANAVLDGKDLDGIDYALPGKLLGFAESLSVNEGYLAFASTFATGTPTGVDATYKSGYVRTVALGQDPKATIPYPIVSTSVNRFSTESSGLSILSAAIASTPAFSEIKLVDIDLIPGTSAAVAMTYADPYTSGSTVNSARIMMLIGNDVVILDVQGDKDGETALASAVALATQQAGCFTHDGDCGTAQLPAGFADAKG